MGEKFRCNVIRGSMVREVNKHGRAGWQGNKISLGKASRGPLYREVNIFFPIHRTYFCIRRTDGAARIYFFLSLSLQQRVTLWSRIILVHVREREERRKKEEKEKSPEKPLRHDQDLNPRTRLHSWVCYPLSHGALPNWLLKCGNCSWYLLLILSYLR